MTADTLPTLRDYQQDGVDQCRAQYAAGHRRVLYVLPTGGGKTYVFSYIAASVAAKGGRVVILVHKDDLLRQASESLRSIGVPHGIIAPGYPWEPRRSVQVASVRTLANRLEKLESAAWRPTLIVIDEAHHAVAPTWGRVLAHWPTVRVLGVTATPARANGVGLASVFGAMVEGPQIGELIARGQLAPPVVYRPPSMVDLTGVRSVGGDYDRGELAKRTDKATVTGDAVEQYARICPGTPAIVFCVSVAHAEHVAEQFRAGGWRFQSIDGAMQYAERRRLIDDLGAGRLDGLCSCDLISEGTDIPVVGAAILLRATRSLALYIQSVGRALRLYAGKQRAYIIDHVGVTQIHGLPDDPREWTLDGDTTRKRKAEEVDDVAAPWLCGRCFASTRKVPGQWLGECPQCGEPFQRKPDRMASLKEEEGDLVAVQAAEERVALHKARLSEQAGADTLEQLLEVARRRGYKPGWARRIWEARQAKQSRWAG